MTQISVNVVILPCIKVFCSFFQNPVTYTSFDCLSLPIPTLSLLSTLSLACILDGFTHTELVHGVECLECSKMEEGGGGGGVRKGQGDGDRQTSAGNSPETSPQASSKSEKCKRVFQKQMTISKVRGTIQHFYLVWTCLDLKVII